MRFSGIGIVINPGHSTFTSFPAVKVTKWGIRASETSSEISCNLWVVSKPRSRMLAQHGRRKAPHGQLRGLERGWFFTESQHACPRFPQSSFLSLPVLNTESFFSPDTKSNLDTVHTVHPEAIVEVWFPDRLVQAFIWNFDYLTTSRPTSRWVASFHCHLATSVARVWGDIGSRCNLHTGNFKPVLYSPHRPSPSPWIYKKNRVNKNQGIVGCTPTNIPLWEIPKALHSELPNPSELRFRTSCCDIPWMQRQINHWRQLQKRCNEQGSMLLCCWRRPPVTSQFESKLSYGISQRPIGLSDLDGVCFLKYKNKNCSLDPLW